MTRQFSRRDFLKMSSSALVAALVPAWTWPPQLDDEFRPPSRKAAPYLTRMGRVTAASTTVYEEAKSSARRVGSYRRDESFNIIGETRAPGLTAHNDLWYETETGYVFSGWVQPMLKHPLQPTYYDVGEWGFWAEVCQPYTSARMSPHPSAAEKYRYYYGTTYRIIGVQRDDQGNDWYQAYDELPPETSYWVLAQHMRRITRAEMSPIRPFAGNKRIEVDLSQQVMTCFEGDNIVFVSRCASGAAFTMDDGSVADFSTPKGEHSVLLKQASRHMVGDDPASPDYFDLPGIPWDTFFDLDGRAIHGTYWHNDFGVPRSHGCVNVPIDVARWVYRWTHPLGAYEDDFIRSNWRVGTPILIY